MATLTFTPQVDAPTPPAVLLFTPQVFVEAPPAALLLFTPQVFTPDPAPPCYPPVCGCTLPACNGA